MIGIAMKAEICTTSGGLNGAASSGRSKTNPTPLAPTVLVMMFDSLEQLADLRARLNGRAA